MSNMCIFGAQWGDEGKGKIVDLLAERAEIVARFGGGSNAGHTLVVGKQRVAVHLLPSGVIRPSTVCVLGPGMVIDPATLLDEIASIGEAGFPLGPDRLRISDRAHLVMPYHRKIDQLREERRGAIGTTRRGIGPCYEDKVARRGLRVCDLRDDLRLLRRLEASLDHANQTLRQLGGEAVDGDDLMESLRVQREQLLPYIDDVSLFLRRSIADQRQILFEGAQGALLDIDHGTYPFVTSSNTLPGGLLAGAGVGARDIGTTVAVCKAYITRVGGGPMPTELKSELGEQMLRKGAEFGTTTGRARRCGWLDVPALRYALSLSGADCLALTKLDVLQGFETIRLARAYRLPGSNADILTVPADSETLDQVEVVYEDMPGFDRSIDDVRQFDDLPIPAKRYIERIEDDLGVPVAIVSVGPDRDQTIIRQDVWSFS